MLGEVGLRVVAIAGHSFELRPLSVAGLERLLDRLPAQTRAQLAWTPNELRKALSDFARGERDEAGLRALVRQLLDQQARLGVAVRLLVSQPDLLRSELEGVWRDDRGILAKHLDAQCNDAAEWVFRGLIALMDLSMPFVRAIGSELPTLVAAGATALEEPGSPIRAQALIMTAMELVRAGGDDRTAMDLVYRAYDEIMLMLEQLQAAGIHLDPFHGETIAERAARTRRYADYVRRTLTDDDVRGLDASRMRALR